MDVTQKTVFLLDHCKLMTELSGVQLTIDTGSRQQANSAAMYFPFIPNLMKTLWTCIAETTLEYARIVWDLEKSRLIRFITSNTHSAISLNNWTQAQQTMAFVHEAFAAAGPPLNSPGSIQIGIQAAVKALAEPAPNQQQTLTAVGKYPKKSSHTQTRTSAGRGNRGRIICITSCLVDFDIQDFVLSTLTKHNGLAINSTELLPIDLLEFTLISLHPVRKEHLSRVLSRSRHEVSPIFFSETYVLTPATFHDKLVDICVDHHNLVTTTVTAIPMKEEATASSSINYDVPLFHPRTACSNGDAQTLKWNGPAAPKGSGPVYLCTQACRVTPVDVLSRPTTCLSNFVMNGRSVWLETPKKSATGKTVTSNVLQCHGGEIWLHVMEVNRSVLEDPPSISEGSGGRVTDYRIPDFVELMKQNMLAPYDTDPLIVSSSAVAKYNASNSSESQILPFERAKQRLLRKTIFWPITINSSILFSLTAHLDTLLRLFPKDTLDEMEKVECEKNFWSLMAIEARGDHPPALSSYHLKKGLKKDEQWRLVYGEIETFLRANIHSSAHRAVLDCFIDSRRKDDDTPTATEGSKANGGGGTNGNDVSMPSSEKGPLKRSNSISTVDGENRPGKSSKRLRLENEASSDSNHSNTNNADSGQDPSSRPKMNLLAFWRLKTEKQDRLVLPSVIKLYSHLTTPATATNAAGSSTETQDKDERVAKL